MNFAKLNKFTKFIFISLGLILLINLILLLSNQGNTTENVIENNSELINSLTNSTSDDYLNTLSYPKDYSTWNGNVVLLPTNILQLDSYNSLSESCGLVEGMKVMYSLNLKDLAIVTNRNLIKTQIQRDDYTNAEATISGEEFPNGNAELATFKNYCSSLIMDIIAESDKSFDNFDSSRIIFGALNGKNRFSTKLDNIGVYIYAYAKKGDYLVLISRSFYAEEFITQDSFVQCKDEKLDDYSCVKKFYDKDASIRNKVDSEITNILETYIFR